MFDLSGKRVWVAGHRGMVGSAVVRRLGQEGCDILTAGRDVLDLVDQQSVRDWIAPAGILFAAGSPAPAGSAVAVAGRLNTTQCHQPLPVGASGS